MIRRITIESADHYSVLEGWEADEMWNRIVIAAQLDVDKSGNEWGPYNWKVYQEVPEKDMVSLETTHDEPTPPVVRCPGCLKLPDEHPSDECPCIWVEEIRGFVMKGAKRS